MTPRPSSRSLFAQRWALRGLAGLGCVLAGWALWLAVETRQPPIQPTAIHRVIPIASTPAPAAVAKSPEKPKRLSEREYVAIAGLCPTALNELPPEMLPERLVAERLVPEHRLTSLKTPAEPVRGRLTGVRVAQAPAAEADGWLVSPEAWYAPEDQPAAPAETAEPVAEPIDPPLLTEPTTPQQAPEPPAAEQPLPVEPPAAEAPASTSGDATPWPVDRGVESGPSYPDTDKEPATGWEAESGPSFAPPGVAPLVETPPSGAPAEPAPVESPSPPLPTPTETPEEPPYQRPTPGWEGPFDSVVPEVEDEREFSPRPKGPSPEREPTRPEVTLPEPPTPEPVPESPAPESVPAPAKPAVVQPKPAANPVPPPQPVAIPTKPSPLFQPPTPKRQPVSATLSTAGPTHPGGGAKAAVEAKQAAEGKSADESHRELFAKNNYPSAMECAKCHQRIFDEWSVSSHAYAFVSPMYHRFEETITQLSQGTVGHFCQRCHSPVATAMYEPRSTPIGQMASVAREGVTCIVCHRVNQRWGKSNGDRRIVPGDQYAPVYGGVGGDGVAAAIADKKGYKVKTSPEEKGPGQPIHTEGRFFDQLTKAEACTSCHQVAVHPGVKLEVVWEQYRASPACKKGVTCQDCHMGRVPGLAQGYNYGPIAELNGKTVNNRRKQSSHIFYGPGYSIAHPGIFPHNKDAADWTVDEWMLFDWRAGWGTDDFEERIDEFEDNDIETSKWFPKVWAETDDRADAREVIEDNLERLAKKRRYRELVMENGSKVDGPFFGGTPTAGQDLKFEYLVANQNEGHNLPTASLGAQPQLWANVVLIAPDGRRVWESGYTDSNGDLCDIHSVDVRHGRIPFDKQLFNLQTMFLISGATGTDREFYLPVNLDIDQIAQLRPGALPITVLNHPPFIRMESRSLAPLGKKRVKYTVPAELLRQRGQYRLSFRLRNRTEPMYFMRLCKSTPEMLRAMTEGTLDIHPQSVEFYVR